MNALSELPYVIGNVLTRVGAHCPPRVIHRIDKLHNYLDTGRWLKDNGFIIPPRLKSRDEVFAAAAKEILDKEVLYLEFGVFEGDTMRYWSRNLTNPRSWLHGFDSFDGLPETWNARRPKGCFSTGGKVPQINDPRVKFFKGWFKDTLPNYTPPPHEHLVINIDADLYSSAKLVLSGLKSEITVGTYLYFDEFCDPEHELKAFHEFLTETGEKFEMVAAYRDLSGVMFRRVA
jgi:hypothetical protein